jgi:hypothetical protein
MINIRLFLEANRNCKVIELWVRGLGQFLLLRCISVRAMDGEDHWCSDLTVMVWRNIDQV